MIENPIKIIEPEILTFITTFKCTAACKNCCFQCSPKPKKMMTFNNMKNYFNLVVKTYPNIKLLVFTGGECTLLGNDLFKMIKYASEKNIRTRIVTNGWWANGEEYTLKYISKLKKAGLDEINFSTGDDHQRWIDFKKVRNASIAAFQNKIITAINVETKDNYMFNIMDILKKDRFFNSCTTFSKENQNSKIYIERGLWAHTGKHQNDISYNDFETNIKESRCKNLFNVIPINPYGEVLACCGITSESNPYMRIGNINKENIKQIYERSFKDIIKIWLYTEGPNKIEDFIIQKQSGIINQYKEHACVKCRKIFCNDNNIRILKENKRDFLSNIILKYSFIYKNKQYEEKC